MSNSRFSITNYAEAATIKNGSGGGAPARDETSPFLMERALNADRYSLYKTGSGGAAFAIDIDLGSIKAVRVAAMLGLTLVPTTGAAILTIYYASSYYPGAWSTFGATDIWQDGRRDSGVVASAATSARYWRFNLVLGGGATDFTLGRLWLGNTSSHDLGGRHSPGGESSPFQNRLEQGQQDGSIVLTTLGYPGRDFTLPFNQVPETKRNMLTGVAAVQGSVVFVDAEDDIYEVVVRGGRASVSQAGLLYSAGLEMARLP